MPPRLTLNRNPDTVLTVSTGRSATAVSTYLRLLVEGCAESGALFVAGASSDSHDFDGLALWGPPCDDWLPWCVLIPRFSGTQVLTSWLDQGRRGIPVSTTTGEAGLDNPSRKPLLPHLGDLNLSRALNIVTQALPKYEELYESAFGAWGYNAGINNWQLKAIVVRPEHRRRGLGRALMEVVQQKVTSSKLLVPHGPETTPLPGYPGDAAAPSPSHVPFLTSDMKLDTFSFTIGCPQATASNHKVVVDCHSQIAVRAPSFVAAFSALI